MGVLFAVCCWFRASILREMAQAVGVPIVTTRNADIPNDCPSVRGVYLSDEFDTAALAGNLSQALKTGEGCDPAFVRENHNVAKEVLHLEQHCQQLKK